MEIKLRPFVADDIDAVVQLFRDTIHSVNAKDYTQEQIDAWAPSYIDKERWGVKLLEHYTVVAACDGVICGFGDLHANGYFDHLFVSKDCQGKGVATKIVKDIEAHAILTGVPTITVAVSITAKTFFLKQGYIIISPQEVEFNGQKFTNYLMKKEI